MPGQVHVIDKWNPDGHKQLYSIGMYNLDGDVMAVIMGPKTKISFYSNKGKIKTIVNRSDYPSVAETDNLFYDQIRVSVLKNNTLFFIVLLVTMCLICYLIIKFV